MTKKQTQAYTEEFRKEAVRRAEEKGNFLEFKLTAPLLILYFIIGFINYCCFCS
ncbi:MAG: hypothetical protein OQK03_14265 [Colwellia sp.]|nr:hypothetical protein [Colwellia sp.]MCW8864445.1 hypothetical protein [Colwellia sp.]